MGSENESHGAGEWSFSSAEEWVEDNISQKLEDFTGVSGVTFFLKKIYLFIYLFIFLAALGLCCCVRAFSGCSERGLRFIAVCGRLIAVASLVAEHGL